MGAFSTMLQASEVGVEEAVVPSLTIAALRGELLIHLYERRLGGLLHADLRQARWNQIIYCILTKLKKRRLDRWCIPRIFLHSVNNQLDGSGCQAM
jgi:hypothetical protein